MLTVIIVLVLIAALTFILIKKGKIADANKNNIPDVIETKVEAVVAEVKEEIKKAKKPVAKKPATKATAKTSAKKVVKKSK